jgi:hypothetical protein
MKGFVRQLPGKQFSKIMLQAEVRLAEAVRRSNINDSA